MNLDGVLESPPTGELFDGLEVLPRVFRTTLIMAGMALSQLG